MQRHKLQHISCECCKHELAEQLSDRQTFQHQAAQTRTGATTAGIVHTETLQSSAMRHKLRCYDENTHNIYIYCKYMCQIHPSSVYIYTYIHIYVYTHLQLQVNIDIQL